jgi:hypothetical protein
LKQRVIVKRLMTRRECEDEVHVHKHLGTDTSFPIVMFRGSAVRKELKKNEYVAYTEYAQHGDIEKLIIDNIRARPRRHIPEVFIWVLFRNLVHACQKIETMGLVDLDIKVSPNPHYACLLRLQSHSR